MDSEIKGMSRSNLKTHVTTTMNISPSNCWLQNDVWKKYAYHTHTVLQSVGLSTSATLCPGESCGMQCAGMVPRACLEGNMQKSQEIDLLVNVPEAAAQRRKAHCRRKRGNKLHDCSEAARIKVFQRRASGRHGHFLLCAATGHVWCVATARSPRRRGRRSRGATLKQDKMRHALRQEAQYKNGFGRNLGYDSDVSMCLEMDESALDLHFKHSDALRKPYIDLRQQRKVAVGKPRCLATCFFCIHR